MRLYAIASSLERIEFFLKSEVPYLQIRIKDFSLDPYQSKIRQWIQYFTRTKVIINDDPQLAQQVGAWGVHLGQEDLHTLGKSSFQKFQHSLQIGISTHSFEEIEDALSWKPSYLGFGPIFKTTTKQLDWTPQGVPLLQQVVEKTPCPVVAIGGISLENWQKLIPANPHALAMISGLDAFQEVDALQSFIRRLELS